MRLKLGRPDLAQYDDRFDVPVAGERDLAVTFLGVATLHVDDGSSAILTDGFFSRPGLLDVGLRRISPDLTRIDACLERAGIGRLEAVLPVHTHFDHALDSAVVADRTGAMLVGGASAAQIGAGHGLAPERIRVAEPGRPMSFGTYEITMIESEHCPPDRFPGVIDEPLTPPAKAAAYRCGEAWSIIVRHTSGRSLLIQGSAGYVEGALTGLEADVVYLGVGQLGIQDDDYIETYWRETVCATGARRAVLIHWDDFFRPLTRPLRALPYAGDDLGHTMRVLTRLADTDAVTLSFPTVWSRENPWEHGGNAAPDA
jgi:L-ascorbate metabolism protein UlaG (beta-lactamase superfamily)